MLSIQKTHGTLALTLAVVATAGVASADVNASVTTARGQENVTYQFSDELLDGGGFGPNDTRIWVSSHPIRCTLIRPRTAFVMEMFKSVEAL
jgi:hypothetical protein